MKLTKEMLTEMVKEVIKEQSLDKLLDGVKNDGYEWNDNTLTVFLDISKLLRFFKAKEIGVENSGKGPNLYLTFEKRNLKNHPLNKGRVK